MGDHTATSSALIKDWGDPRHGNAHYTKWRAGKKKLAIKKCGLSHSEYGNNSDRNEILRHLAATDLPLDAGAVLRTLRSKNILHAGASSRQHLAYVLLRNMTPIGGLAVLYVQREPALRVKGPTREMLVNEALQVFETHIFGIDCVPCAYKFDESALSLWKPRRSAWPTVVATLGTDKGMQKFMDWLVKRYCT